MCRPQSWSQMLLPVFFSLFLVQLFIIFSENSFSQVSRHKNKHRPKSMDDAYTVWKKCQLCTENSKCFWCSEERACRKICFPYFGCHFSSIFWLNCHIDMFGFLMLLLIAILIIVFICQCFIYQYYLQTTQVYIAGRPHTIYIPHGTAPGKYYNLFDEVPQSLSVTHSWKSSSYLSQASELKYE
ncbi:PTTG1IP family member 2 [Mesoplodon densirostris]|uniref:PTTG1IP family member 2 n=1 Tax=Mesoplodon densirostris TaxID=48708 RepID=UPI0028DCB989|nr:PTTG1IP family member 2 [Mesoplodon densirostris]